MNKMPKNLKLEEQQLKLAKEWFDCMENQTEKAMITMLLEEARKIPRAHYINIDFDGSDTEEIKGLVMLGFDKKHEKEVIEMFRRQF